ncbi:MAG TPA: CoA ester lyase [Noviherbaspirillum sp.]|uniref:HpcH/HpaI aldolase/citrate lyase family protein n=1 Tax=Noviherbaspirillum sp. TaxID=1926288 RepID=UPI002B4A982C|nr:CoA ester lyase [Noviherbaspirillum sp.]HJV84553.1 CoA ester lyase [Noviherbaspirillum sp.]
MRRSQLVTPASSLKMIEKGAKVDCDSLIIDLEDAIAPDKKDEARIIMRNALTVLHFEHKEIGVRINGLESPWFLDDLLALGGMPIDTIVVPKVHGAEDVHACEAMVRQLELRGGMAGKTLQLLIESARGLENITEIARASSRCEALIFGVGDYIADTGIAFNSRALWYARSRVAAAAAAAGIQALDHVHPEVANSAALAVEAAEARDLGFTGKWAIHPLQVPVINEAFSPNEKQIAQAQRVIEAYEQSLARGIGAIVVDGTLVDEASLKIARRHQGAALKMGRCASPGS